MGLFGNFFKNRKIKISDKDFGEMESYRSKGNRIGWKTNLEFLNTDIEILMEGDPNGIKENQRQIVLDALNNKAAIKSEAVKALKEQFENAEMEFVSIEKHFEVRGISVYDEGFEIAFQEKEEPYYFFNVYFENNKQMGVSIDG